MRLLLYFSWPPLTMRDALIEWLGTNWYLWSFNDHRYPPRHLVGCQVAPCTRCAAEFRPMGSPSGGHFLPGLPPDPAPNLSRLLSRRAGHNRAAAAPHSAPWNGCRADEPDPQG